MKTTHSVFRLCFKDTRSGWRWKRFWSAVGLFLFSISPVLAQDDRFQQNLERFDRRAAEVSVIVESSRDPQANTLYENAIRTRDQAESAYRQGNTQMALSLIDRALAFLVQAENVARGHDLGDAEMERVRRLLVSLRQNLQDSRRWLHDLEVSDRDTEAPNNVSSFLEEQKERIQSLLSRVEKECAQADSARCQDLLERARALFQQAEGLLPNVLDPITVDRPRVENRLRDARQFLDKAQTELDQIEKELNRTDRIDSSSVSRIRNVENLIRYGNDRLQEADIQGSHLQQGQSTFVLTLLRRANELAQLALRSNAEDSFLEEDYRQRNDRVEAIRQEVESFEDLDGAEQALFQQGVDLLDQANREANAGRFEMALHLLSQANTAFNNVLAQINTQTGGVQDGGVFTSLKTRFENDYRSVESVANSNPENRVRCGDQLRMARERADRADEADQAGNHQLALFLLNQAQQSLSAALTCLGQSPSKIVDVLNRLQAQFDKRVTAFEQVAKTADEAASVYLAEAKNLRRLSDTQESAGNYEQAIRTVGLAIKNLGTLQRLMGSRTSQSDADLLESIQRKFDQRVDRVRERVESGEGSVAAEELLDRADQLRRDSEEAARNGNHRLGLTQMGQAISLLERAALGS